MIYPIFTLPTLKVVTLKNKVNQQNKVPVYLQFTFRKKVNRISLKVWVPLKSWVDQSGNYLVESGSLKAANAKELNFFFHAVLQKGNKIILDSQNNDKVVSFREFKDIFSGKQQDDFYAFHHSLVERRTKQGYSKGTIKNYWKEYRKLKQYKSTLFFREIDYRFLDEYKTYLVDVKKNDVNTIWKSMCYLRLMINEAINYDIVADTPFKKYKIKYVDRYRDFLDYSEIDRLEKLYQINAIKPSHQNVLSYFLFACFTGLDYADICSLTNRHITIEKDRYYISRKRTKTGHHYIVPLTKKALSLIDIAKIKENEETPIFRILSNQKTNKYLKEIINTVNIRKKVSFHTARHSFATLSLNLGVPKEVVQKMLSHQSSDMTDHYAKMMKTFVATEMDRWDQSNPASAN